MLNIGPQELLVILLVALIIVGPKRLPELSRTIGRGLRELRKAQDEVRRTISLSLEEPAEPVSRPSPATGAVAGADDGDVGEDAISPEGASEPASGSEGSEVDAASVARTLGRGLAELRRAREEIQRTFHVDLTDQQSASSSDGPGTRATPAPDEPAAEA